MVSRLVAIPFDCSDPDLLAAFWADVLGWQVTARGWQRTPYGRSGATVKAQGAAAVELDFRWVPDGPKVSKNRIHFDLSPVDRDQAAELARLLELGAALVDVGQQKVSWHVLADPEGNEFCLCRDRVEPLERRTP
jgi:catechol-2,3-dioxygenase